VDDDNDIFWFLIEPRQAGVKILLSLPRAGLE
jgi:hypothetical protein